MAPALAGGAPKEGTLAVCGKPGWPPPPPSTEGCTKQAAGASTASLAPRPSHSQTIGDLCSLPRRPHPRSPSSLGRRHLLVYRCRGSGVATSHVSRGPGALGRAAPHRAGQRQRSQAPETVEAKGLPPGPSPEVSALQDPERGSGTWAPQSKSTSCA